MKFICLVYFEPGALDGLSEAERAELDRDSLAYDEGLQKSGHFIAAAALQSTRTARTLRKRNGQVVLTDGPFAETREMLGGFIFIEAADMDEAMRIAGNIPMAKYASIEVRPELDFG